MQAVEMQVAVIRARTKRTLFVRLNGQVIDIPLMVSPGNTRLGCRNCFASKKEGFLSSTRIKRCTQGKLTTHFRTLTYNASPSENGDH